MNLNLCGTKADSMYITEKNPNNAFRSHITPIDTLQQAECRPCVLLLAGTAFPTHPHRPHTSPALSTNSQHRPHYPPLQTVIIMDAHYPPSPLNLITRPPPILITLAHHLPSVPTLSTTPITCPHHPPSTHPHHSPSTLFFWARPHHPASKISWRPPCDLRSAETRNLSSIYPRKYYPEKKSAPYFSAPSRLSRALLSWCTIFW